MTDKFSVHDFVLINDVEEKKEERIVKGSRVSSPGDLEGGLGSNRNVNNPTDGYYDEDEAQFRDKNAEPEPQRKKELKPSKFDNWDSVKSRNHFIAKVFIIVMGLLLYNLVIICIFVFIPPVKKWAMKYWWLSLVFGLCFLPFALILGCVPSIARKVPVNYILLVLAATFMGLSLGCVSAFYDMFEVLLAVGITTAVVLLLAIIAIFSKCDFTILIGVVAVLCFCFLIFGLFMIFFQDRIMSIIYCSIGTIIASLCIVIDIQMICGGKNRRYQYSEKDYAIASLTLYIDIAFLFIMILGLTGAANR